MGMGPPGGEGMGMGPPGGIMVALLVCALGLFVGVGGLQQSCSLGW